MVISFSGGQNQAETGLARAPGPLLGRSGKSQLARRGRPSILSPHQVVARIAARKRMMGRKTLFGGAGVVKSSVEPAQSPHGRGPVRQSEGRRRVSANRAFHPIVR